MKPSGSRWRYRLHVDINPTDAAVLRDAIDGEPFGLVKRFGLDEIRRMIDAFAIEVDAESDERWLELDNDVAILSLYLSQEQITASEIQVAPILRAWRLVGRRGQTVRLDLEVGLDAKDGAIVLGEEDVDALEARWATLPEWARASLRHKFPDLDVVSEPRPGS
jgi:hypothetical protein